MDNRKKSILIWMLTWAGLLVAVLYSPFGSPELYKPNSYVEYQGVDFNNRNIANAGAVKKTTGNSSGISVPDYSKTQSSSYKVSNSTNQGNNNGGAYSSRIDNGSANHSGTGAGEEGDLSSVSIGSKSKGSNDNQQNNGYLSSMSDINQTNGINNPFQGANQGGSLDGTTDPGGDPTGPPIPIPDGWGFLILLASIYIVSKKYFFTKS